MNKKTTHIIVTVGASLISNMLDTIEDKDRDLPKLNNLIWNRLEKAAISDEDDRRRYLILEKRINGFYRKGYKRIPNVTNKSKRWNDSDSDIININASAEITSIVKIYDDLKNGIKNKTTDSRAATQKIKITLLYTDTYLSQYCAGKIKDWLEYFKEEGEYPLIDKVDSRHIPK